MGLDVWNGSAWVDAKDVRVWGGSSWTLAKKVKTWNGSAWVLSWVPPVTSATLSLSKTGVQQNEAYDVTLTAPGGFPEGAAVTFRFTGYSQTVYPAEGATTATLSGAMHASTGSIGWYADVVTMGGTTTFGPVTQSVTSSAYSVTLASGSTRAQIQAAMDAASSWYVANKTGPTNFDDPNTMASVVLAAGGTFTLDGEALHYRRGVRLVGGGSGASRPLVKGTSATHIFNGDNNGGGLYNAPHYDWLVENIRFDCNNFTGGFSIAHVRRFRIKGCDFSNMGGKKHYIEINSSGGARQDGIYNAQVYDCYFTMTNTSPANGEVRRTEDECIQLDYSWTSAAANVANDGTVANNVIISGCSFYRVPRAIGGHKYEPGTNGRADPAGIHSNVLITGCTFTEVDPDAWGNGANSPNSEGAVRGYVWRNVRVTGCTFVACMHPVNFFIPADAFTGNGEPGEYRVDGCTFTSSARLDASSRHHFTVNTNSGHASLKHEQVLVESNTVDGTWYTTTYSIECWDTGTETLPASTATVVLRFNRWQPSNKTLAEEKAYNKYRAKGSGNAGEVLIYDNTVSDGSISNA